MNEEKEITQEQSADTEAAEIIEEEGESTEKSFTQNEVNELIQARLERAEKKFYTRYGLDEGKKELDELVGRGQAYNVISEKYTSTQELLKSATQELAFLKNNISPERYDDIKIYFKGKGETLDDSTLQLALENHPEWLKESNPQTTIEVLGGKRENREGETDKERAMKLFGITKE